MQPKPYLVLVADDNDIDRFFLRRAIHKASARLRVVCEVEDGEEVVAYLSGRGSYSNRKQYPLPDLLILDTRMPHLDGLGVLKWLKTQNFNELKVAVFADSSGTNLQSQALASGASFFFSKIVHEPELIQIVQSLQEELDRGRQIQVLLQHTLTGCYLRADNRWTPLLHEGLEFESLDEAADFARAEMLGEIVQMVLFFSADGQKLVMPVGDWPNFSKYWLEEWRREGDSNPR